MNVKTEPLSCLMTASLLVLACCAPACGGRVVQFPLDRDTVTGPPPWVISTVPADSGAVSVTTVISATFSTDMDPATIDESVFTLWQGSTQVVGTVAYDDVSRTATFFPLTALELDRIYTALISTEVMDELGVAMEAEHMWSFMCSHAYVYQFSATTGMVATPDYTIAVSGLVLLVDANNRVQGASGAAELTAGFVTGQQYVVAQASGLTLYSEINLAFQSGTAALLTTSIPAADFDLVGADLTDLEARTLILANTSSDVFAYQVFEITFHPAE